MAQLHYWIRCDEMLNKPHILIAGCTGSGKSVMLNSMIYTLLTYQPNEKQMMLIDPKRVELSKYKRVPHCIGYAFENHDTLALLKKACAIMEKRFEVMDRNGLDMYNGSDLYIIIDEFADLMTTMPKEASPLVQRIAQMGRAARIHILMCTQAPNRQVLKANVILNFTDRLALHCNDKIESRQIIGEAGAETLPRYGKGIYKSADGMCLMDIPFTPADEIANRISFWTGSEGTCNEGNKHTGNRILNFLRLR